MSTQELLPPRPPLRPEQRAARLAVQVAGQDLIDAVQLCQDDDAIMRAATHFSEANRAWLDVRDTQRLQPAR